jgi:HEAT repeat protein
MNASFIKVAGNFTKRSITSNSLGLLALVVSLGLGLGVSFAAETSPGEAAKEKERQLIAVLKSDAPPQDKAIPCKQLAIYGSKEAVPALAALLSNTELASWARIALEAIPDPAADAALRAAVPNLQGKLLVGVINSIGYRRDPKAAGELAKKLQDADAEVGSAAAVALGRIGNAEAAKVLKSSLPTASDAIRSAVAQGCILCAERFLARGRNTDAVKLYDMVRSANVAKQRRLEAIRGAILARKMDGLPLLLEQLRSTDKGELSIGLSTARELPGQAVTEALAAEVRRQSPERQSFLLLALGDRHDAAVMPAVLDAARSGPAGLRLAAVGVLERIGNPAAVPVLLEAAAQGEPELSQKALTALARQPGNEIDKEILARLPASKGKMRQALVDVAGRRRIEGAMPLLVQSAEDSDAGVRNAAVEAIGTLGQAPQAADLVRLLGRTQNSKERADMEAALIAIAGRTGARCVPNLLPLARSTDSALRLIALQALTASGGSEALATVVAAAQDQDESVQDEAVRTLSTWPNNWPDDSGVAVPLLELAKSGKKSSHQVLGLRGYLQYLQTNKKLGNDDKVSKVNEVLPLIQRPEEKRLVIGVVDTIPTDRVLELLTTFAAEPATTDDACTAIVKLATGKMPAVSAEQRQKALQTVVDKSENDTTKKKAADLLRTS